MKPAQPMERLILTLCLNFYCRLLLFSRKIFNFSVTNYIILLYLITVHALFSCQRRIQRDFTAGKPVWDPNFELFPNVMSNTIDKYILITFSIVNNPYLCHPYMFITENYSSEFKCPFELLPQNPMLKTVFPKSPAENGIPKKSLDTLLVVLILIRYGGYLIQMFVSIFEIDASNDKNQKKTPEFDNPTKYLFSCL